MYLTNKYSRWYEQIIQRAKERVLPDTVYTERHHVIPQSLGGTNDKSNIVVLTAREHFICHWMLTKMVNGNSKYKVWNAFSCMLYRRNDSQEDRYRVNSRIFENMKKEGSKIKSERFSGKGNPAYGKKRSIESRQKQSQSAKGRVVSEKNKREDENFSKAHRAKL
jgi:hypothetical protein